MPDALAPRFICGPRSAIAPPPVLMFVPPQVPFILFVVASFPLAISAVLILMIDVGCDLLPSISLAYEPKEVRQLSVVHCSARRRALNKLFI